MTPGTLDDCAEDVPDMVLIVLYSHGLDIVLVAVPDVREDVYDDVNDDDAEVGDMAERDEVDCDDVVDGPTNKPVVEDEEDGVKDPGKEAVELTSFCRSRSRLACFISCRFGEEP